MLSWPSIIGLTDGTDLLYGLLRQALGMAPKGSVSFLKTPCLTTSRVQGGSGIGHSLQVRQEGGSAGPQQGPGEETDRREREDTVSKLRRAVGIYPQKYRLMYLRVNIFIFTYYICINIHVFTTIYYIYIIYTCDICYSLVHMWYNFMCSVTQSYPALL